MKDKEAEKILKALGNKRRIAIIRAIGKGEMSVGDIADKIHLSFKSTSRHLSILSAVDILDKSQKGTQIFYRLSATLSPIARQIISYF